MCRTGMKSKHTELTFACDNLTRKGQYKDKVIHILFPIHLLSQLHIVIRYKTREKSSKKEKYFHLVSWVPNSLLLFPKVLSKL